MIPGGLVKLGGSSKACLCIAILIIITIALFLGKMSGGEFIAGATVISGIYCSTAAYVDGKNGGSPDEGI